MATYTENYNLLKPEDADFYSVEDFNENMDTIDTLMAENEAAVTGIDGKIGNPGDTGTDTLFGAVAQANNGGSVIKNIQHLIMEGSTHSTKTFDIDKVDLSKTFVLMERLAGTADYYADVEYSLSATELKVSVTCSSSSNFAFGFWIIEFN